MSGDQSDNLKQEGLPFKEVQPGSIELSPDKDRTPSIERVIGEVIDGRYQLLSAIGQGGMGYVYKAKQLTTGRTLAIKMLSSKASATDAHMMRFQQEAKAACAFSHANAVHVYDFGITSDGIPYLTMQFVEGKTLADEIAHNGALDQDSALLIFGQIASALAAAHDQHVLHRDIKPSNIMLVPIKEEPHRSAMLLDFGIAKLEDADPSQLGLTKTGEVFGTPFYMSPEQCRGQKLDQRSDIYSLGCVMYEALTGVPPFYGENFLQILYRHINDVPQPLSAMRMNGTISSDLQKIVMKCLAKDPLQRFASMEEVKKALAQVDSVSQITESMSATKTAGTTGSAISSKSASPIMDDQTPSSKTSGTSRTDFRSRKPPLALISVLFVVVAVGAAFYLLPRNGRKATAPAINSITQTARQNPASEISSQADGNEQWQKSLTEFIAAAERDDFDAADKYLRLAVEQCHSPEAKAMLADRLERYSNEQSASLDKAKDVATKRSLAERSLMAMREVPILTPSADIYQHAANLIDHLAREPFWQNPEQRKLIDEALATYQKERNELKLSSALGYSYHQSGTLLLMASDNHPGEGRDWLGEAKVNLTKSIETYGQIYADPKTSPKEKNSAMRELADNHYWLGYAYELAKDYRSALAEFRIAEPFWRQSHWDQPIKSLQDEIDNCEKKLRIAPHGH
jgi:serine/threonine protein kinase